jgi:glutamate/tyrosine decarboxylase-like PLP-dependent enzyme
MMASGKSKVQVLSTMPHSSIGKAASITGIGRANVIGIAKSGTTLEIDLERLEQEAGKRGVATILAISAGEVNTGRFATKALDHMRKIREICDRHHVWVHVDGAFGLFGRVLKDCDGESEYAEIVKGCEGIELADSITGDGHKLLNVPYDCGFFFTRHKGLTEEVFRNGNAAYLTSGAGAGDQISSPLNIGIENSRRFRALPVYVTLATYGRQGYIDMLCRQIGLARRITGWLFDHPEFQVLPQVDDRQTMIEKTFMIVLFRAVDEKQNVGLVKRINETGKMYVTGTQWDGRLAARIAVSNWQADIERDGKIIEEVLTEVIS